MVNRTLSVFSLFSAQRDLSGLPVVGSFLTSHLVQACMLDVFSSVTCVSSPLQIERLSAKVTISSPSVGTLVRLFTALCYTPVQ